MSVMGVESAIYAVDDLPLCSKFFSEFGLPLAQSSDNEAVFRLEDFVPPLWPLFGAAAIAAFVVMLIGLFGTRRVLRTSPMALLRE